MSLYNTRFSHPGMEEDLWVRVNPNEISWGYGLNTANFSTYGGEVVQILSMFFDDMTISGQTRSYRELEQIYYWFQLYMQTASQRGQYDGHPVTFKYLERQWEFQIYPKDAPGFKYGRDVVGPEWRITAAVYEAPNAVGELSKAEGIQQLVVDQGQSRPGDVIFGRATAEIGYNPDNPFSGPTEADFKKGIPTEQLGKLGDYYNSLIPAYAGGDFKNLTANLGSGPVFLNPTQNTFNTGGSSADGTATAKQTVDKRKK